MKRWRRSVGLFLFLVAPLSGCARGNAFKVRDNAGQTAFVRMLMEEIRTSYPQLAGSKFKIDNMASDFTYLETRFTLASFFFSSRLDYQIMFNPGLMQHEVPPQALRGIVAHELAHADYFHSHNRLALLGLVRLVFPSFRARFERGADLEAIDWGYGQDLKLYRVWLYNNVPPNRVWEKKRDYFSPEEIDAIERARAQQPLIISTLERCVPLDLREIERDLNDPARACSTVSH